MGYVTLEQITQAKELDLLTYLQQYDQYPDRRKWGSLLGKNINDIEGYMAFLDSFIRGALE